jgi:hypothetical protein
MTAGVPLAPLIPLPASTVEWWLSELQLVHMVGWIGQKRASNLGFLSYPPYQGSVAPDPPYFRGRPVAWSTQTGSAGAYWRGTGLSTLLAAGTHPWTYVVARVNRTAAGQAAGIIASFGVGTSYYQRLGALSAKTPYAQHGGPDTVYGPDAADNLPHRYRWWSDGAFIYLRIDEGEWSLASARTLGANITSVSLGGSVGASPMECRIALMIMCASKPTLGEENALDAWVRTYYGLP